MQEYLAEFMARDRLESFRRFAERQALGHARRPARRPWRATVGLALIRTGRWVLRGMPERPAVVRRRTARPA